MVPTIIQAAKLHSSQWWVLRSYLLVCGAILLIGAAWSNGAISELLGAPYFELFRKSNDLVVIGGPLWCMGGALICIILFGFSIARRPLSLILGTVWTFFVICFCFYSLGKVSVVGLGGDYLASFKACVMPLAGLSGAVLVWLVVCGLVLRRN